MSNVQQSGSTVTYSLHKFRVLLVEDYDFMQSLVSGMLRAFGVGDVVICNGGEDAKAALSSMVTTSKLVDLVITDWMMPEGTGDDLTRWIRDHENETMRFLPVLTISSYANKEMIESSRDSGANEALVKPLSGEKLARRILAIIDGPRSFVKSPDFFGPDRRRKNKNWTHEERRKTDPTTIEVHDEQE